MKIKMENINSQYICKSCMLGCKLVFPLKYFSKDALARDIIKIVIDFLIFDFSKYNPRAENITHNSQVTLKVIIRSL